MFFDIKATITMTREVSGRINVNKKDLVDSGYPTKEDGDSTAWYGYVAEFLENEFETHEPYGYHVSDIQVLEDSNEAGLEDVTDIAIEWG